MMKTVGLGCYKALWIVLLPFIFVRLWWRYRHTPSVPKGILERLGWYARAQRCSSSIVLHAVSLGESIAATPFLKQLSERYPNETIVVTSMTASGRLHIQKCGLKNVKPIYFPYDLAARAFLNAVNPRMVLLMETELWPNFLMSCQTRRIPVVLLNARMSERSCRRYLNVPGITRFMMNALTLIAAQSEADRERFIKLGALSSRVYVTGSLKFDMDIPASVLEQAQQLREKIGKNRPVWVAASTHLGEEEYLFKAHRKIRLQFPNALLILAPRHIERADSLRQLIQKHEFTFTSRTRNERELSDSAVYLADTLGELMIMYAAGDAAFVGGSLIERGGHNLLEPALLGKPVLSGPSLFNFQQISDYLLAKEALIIVTGEDGLANRLTELFHHPLCMKEFGDRAESVCLAHRGALLKQFEMVEKELEI